MKVSVTILVPNMDHITTQNNLFDVSRPKLTIVINILRFFYIHLSPHSNVCRFLNYKFIEHFVVFPVRFVVGRNLQEGSFFNPC